MIIIIVITIALFVRGIPRTSTMVLPGFTEFFFRLSALVRVPLAAQLGMIFLGFFFVEFQVRYLRTATVD